MKQICTTSKSLLNWYNKNQRDLPWRKNKDPYPIWISEIMLQQTRVETVIEYYYRFLERFPNLQTLAEATEEEVLSIWKGLGYYSRGRNILRTAQTIHEVYRGEFPSTYKQLRTLPGIGDYTAGAILSIAFEQNIPAVDGNVLRVISRLQAIEDDINKLLIKNQIKGIVTQMIPEGKAGTFNQALMELGALICIPRNPKCGQCPVKGYCLAYESHKQNDLPMKKKVKNVSTHDYWAAVIIHDNKILMEYRRNVNLLGNLWGVPIVHQSESDSPENLFDKQYGLKIIASDCINQIKHVFTHQVWNMKILKCELLEEPKQLDDLAWFCREELTKLPIPTAFQKVIRVLGAD